MSQGLAGGLSPSTPIRIQLPGSNFTLTVPGILASQLATSQALAAAAAASQQQSCQESSEKDGSQESSLGIVTRIIVCERIFLFCDHSCPTT